MLLLSMSGGFSACLHVVIPERLDPKPGEDAGLLADSADRAGEARVRGASFDFNQQLLLLASVRARHELECRSLFAVRSCCCVYPAHVVPFLPASCA